MIFNFFGDFQFFRHILGPTVCISHTRFLVISSFFKSSSGCSSRHIKVLQCAFLIFHVHNPCPTVCISHFPRFSMISSFFKSSSGCLIFRDFQFSHHIPGPTECVFIFHVIQ
ncbi:Uncharacterised protein [Chlamydia abortus]|nr:Uncharacterised protein [Chlamydia abortus]